MDSEPGLTLGPYGLAPMPVTWFAAARKAGPRNSRSVEALPPLQVVGLRCFWAGWRWGRPVQLACGEVVTADAVHPGIDPRARPPAGGGVCGHHAQLPAAAGPGRTGVAPLWIRPRNDACQGKREPVRTAVEPVWDGGRRRAWHSERLRRRLHRIHLQREVPRQLSGSPETVGRPKPPGDWREPARSPRLASNRRRSIPGSGRCRGSSTRGYPSSLRRRLDDFGDLFRVREK